MLRMARNSRTCGEVTGIGTRLRAKQLLHFAHSYGFGRANVAVSIGCSEKAASCVRNGTKNIMRTVGHTVKVCWILLVPQGRKIHLETQKRRVALIALMRKM